MARLMEDGAQIPGGGALFCRSQFSNLNAEDREAVFFEGL